MMFGKFTGCGRPLKCIITLYHPVPQCIKNFCIKELHYLLLIFMNPKYYTAVVDGNTHGCLFSFANHMQFYFNGKPIIVACFIFCAAPQV